MESAIAPVISPQPCRGYSVWVMRQPEIREQATGNPLRAMGLSFDVTSIAAAFPLVFALMRSTDI